MQLLDNGEGWKSKIRKKEKYFPVLMKKRGKKNYIPELST